MFCRPSTLLSPVRQVQGACVHVRRLHLQGRPLAQVQHGHGQLISGAPASLSADRLSCRDIRTSASPPGSAALAASGIQRHDGSVQTRPTLMGRLQTGLGLGLGLQHNRFRCWAKTRPISSSGREGQRRGSERDPRSFSRPWAILSSALLAAGACAVVGYTTVFGKAASTPSGQAVCSIVKRGDTLMLQSTLQQAQNKQELVGGRHVFGWAPLHVAAVNNNLEMVRILLDNGADPNVLDEYSPQPSKGHSLGEKAMARIEQFSNMIEWRADARGFTPLMYAVLVDNAEMVQLLLSAGASPSVTNNMGLTALSYCDTSETATNQAKQVAALLSEAAERHQAELDRKAKEQRRQFPLESRLKKHIVGQLGPIYAVAAAVRRRENGWHDEDKPLVFLFLGSSGLGKTVLAKRLSEYLHGDSAKGFIRIDLSEYQHQHEVSKLIGSPPGYVGYGEGNQLADKLKECPNAVVLLDEVEKAHPDVLMIMLQLFDEGRLTDGKGNTIDCKDAIFVMTSNLAADEIAAYSMQLREEADVGPSRVVADDGARHMKSTTVEEIVTPSKQFREQVIRPILKRHFQRDEFLGRINEMVYFLPFSESELRQLVVMELNRWSEKALSRHNVKLSWSEGVVDEIASSGYDVHYGARSIRYEVERRVINQIAAAHEQDLIAPGSEVHVFMDQNATIKLRFTSNGAKGGSGSSGGRGGWWWPSAPKSSASQQE